MIMYPAATLHTIPVSKNKEGGTCIVKQRMFNCQFNVSFTNIFTLSSLEFTVPRIGYPLGGISKNGSHVYVLLQVFRVILLFEINVVLMLPWWTGVTIVQCDITIVIPWQLSTGSIQYYLFCYCPLVGILFEILRVVITNVM